MKIVPAIAALIAAVAPLEAQQPPDSANVVMVSDTVLARVPSDTVPDSLRFYPLPLVDGGAPARFATGVWEFGRDELLAARGLSLADLLSEVPGVIRLRGGDYGAPETVTAFGLAGGEIRVFWDGFEQVPLDGSVVDLATIGLGGVERVRVSRQMGELRVELTSQRDFDARPSTLVEAGTGDSDTNFFTGTFVHPRVLGGGLGVALDRVDTNGNTRLHEDGARTGAWLRYTRHWSDVWLTGELRRVRSNAEVTGYPGRSERGDWMVRALWHPAEGVAIQGFTGRSDLDGIERVGRLDVDRSRRQTGALADVDLGPVSASVALRWFDGGVVPSRTLDLSGSASDPRVGGAFGTLSRQRWDGEDANQWRIGAWTRPVLGLSLFGSHEEGRRGVALWPLPSEVPEDTTEAPEPEPAPEHRFTDRTATRVGATLSWRDLSLSGARVRLETDSLPLLGLPMDRGGMVLPGIEREGFEVAGRIPLSWALPGLAFAGSATFWDEGARYLPKRSYSGGFVFHDTYLPTRNLELWGSLGVEGRDPMQVPVADPLLGSPPPGDAEPVTVPFFQSWYALIQVRVLQLRIFIAWENFTVRRHNQDFPGRDLPVFRAHYGIRWYLWN